MADLAGSADRTDGAEPPVRPHGEAVTGQTDHTGPSNGPPAHVQR